MMAVMSLIAGLFIFIFDEDLDWTMGTLVLGVIFILLSVYYSDYANED